MLLTIEARLRYRLHAPADLLLAVEVAPLPDQRLLEDRLTLWGSGPLRPVAGEEGIGRRTWARGDGVVEALYTALVEVGRTEPDLERLAADPLHALPPAVVPYLWPSRYCDSDRFEPWVRERFGDLAGGAKVAALARWVRARVAYVPGSSTGRTGASDTFVQRQGVCRDFAHLLIALVRAADIPARMVGAYAHGVRPPDFHAVVEVWLDGGWRLLDPTGMARAGGIARICVGRDATDISFLTVFGTADLLEQRVSVERADGPDQGVGPDQDMGVV